jgi:hypothetical protein
VANHTAKCCRFKKNDKITHDNNEPSSKRFRHAYEINPSATKTWKKAKDKVYNAFSKDSQVTNKELKASTDLIEELSLFSLTRAQGAKKSSLIRSGNNYIQLTARMVNLQNLVNWIMITIIININIKIITRRRIVLIIINIIIWIIISLPKIPSGERERMAEFHTVREIYYNVLSVEKLVSTEQMNAKADNNSSDWDDKPNQNIINNNKDDNKSKRKD